ncbi:allantoinase [Dichomitus squalens LYAD-421 SS1]|uniref:allantoinase n=2 Tax=Dichomitus squalens TaxID=114155 RepID=A0A4Q9PS16_9APHY|nr:allantoinase [Dichomitus squalens LYAD-421 SS1]EJF58144.1 allantoinase [Dichomitus squalens LYAD-421 SS1]TBU57125.1 allantoinase [Dichomitus squalens]
MSTQRVFTGYNVVLSDGQPQPATLIVDLTTGKIVDILGRVSARTDFPDVGDADWIDAGGKFILPGIVDAHVHLNEPGRTDWEGFWSGTRAAASGGVTTIVDMPLNSIPPTTTVANLEEKRNAARGQCWTDVAFWGGVIPNNQAHMKQLVEAGVRGFKCFLIESGVEEFPCVNEDDLRLAMNELQNTSTVLCFHAELDKTASTVAAPADADPTLYSTFLASRPQQLEVDAIALITALHRQYPSLRLHIVHLSASDALPLIRAAKQSGLPLTVETCFHYLTLSAQHIPHGRPEFKCCPPIREEANREALWAALLDGTIDCVVSDHSPCVVSLKKVEEGDIMSAWGGISTLGLGLSLLWTEARKRGVGIDRLVDWLCVKTAKHAGLDDRKGTIQVGYDADLLVWDPDAETKVTKESLNFKNKLTPYKGLALRGRVDRTFLRGLLIYDGAVNGFTDLEPVGALL